MALRTNIAYETPSLGHYRDSQSQKWWNTKTVYAFLLCPTHFGYYPELFKCYSFASLSSN
jgi:hypothetical protein